MSWEIKGRARITQGDKPARRDDPGPVETGKVSLMPLVIIMGTMAAAVWLIAILLHFH